MSLKLQKKTRRKTKQSFKRNTSRSPRAAGKDFYKAINQEWFSKTTIPPTQTVFGVSEEIEERIESQLGTLLKSCSTSDKDKERRLLGILRTSVITSANQPDNLKLTLSVLQSIQQIESPDDIATVMGEFRRYGIQTLFRMFGQYESKNRAVYTYTISPGGLGLPDPTYYLYGSMQRRSQYAAYKRMLKRLQQAFQIPHLSCVYRIERLLAAVLLQTDNDTKEYEKTGNELETQFPHIPFATFFDTVGVSFWRSRIFCVESMRWLHALNKMFLHLGLDHWKLLLSLEFLLFAVPWLPPPYSDITFQFYNVQLRGQTERLPLEKRAIYVAEQYATPILSRLYVESFVNPSIKKNVTTMVEDFLHVAEDRLLTVEWLEPETRKKAQEKVKKMRYLVGYPDRFQSYELPELNEETLLVNLLTLGEWTTQCEIQKLGQSITQRTDWEDGTFTVNAYYYSQVNEMVIPAGTLQPPFYDEKRSLAWNYGGIGCIICHELTHAFDKEGKEYDPKGFQNTWWTSTDNRNYNKQTKALIELYGNQRVEGFPVSGKKTLSENIADIGGMGIALDALRKKLADVPSEKQKQAYRDFFTSYAVSWRLEQRRKKKIQALIVDRHAPPSLRVNLVVAQFQEWYDAFEIQPSDPLYISPEKRIHIL